MSRTTTVLAVTLCASAGGLAQDVVVCGPGERVLTSTVRTPDDTIAIWKIYRGFGDPDIKREDLLRQSEAFLRDFPDSRHASRAKESVVILKRMAAETMPPPSKPIERLIFQLRDQNGMQVTQPGTCDIFFWDRMRDMDQKATPDESPRFDRSPARKLVDIGYEAVPALIDHIDDDTFTRSVEFHRSFYFSHRVLRVRDCVMPILDEIVPTGQRYSIGDDVEKTKAVMKRDYRQLIEQARSKDSR
jgi:hypothetical protein